MNTRRFLDPNLASEPFENARPVVRLALLLWTLTFVVGGAAAYLAWDVRRATGEQKQTLDALTAEAAGARDRGARLKSELERADLEEQNVRTGFLNERIAERAFSWNDLFDTLGEVLPRGVRVHDLSPLGFGAVERQGTRAKKTATSSTSLVTMRISGVAEDTDALLTFVDRLYDHPAFSEPNLTHETTEGDGQIEFSLSVGFVPGAAAGGASLAEAGNAGSGERSVRTGAGPASGAPALAGAPGTPTTQAAGTIPPAGKGTLAPLAPSGQNAPDVPASTGAPSAGRAGTYGAAGAAGRATDAGAVPRFRPGANPPPRETTSRFGDPVSGFDEPQPAGVERDPLAPRPAPSDRRPSGGMPLPGGPKPPTLPAPLGPFASSPQGIR